ncbi:MAG: acetyl-CoA synthetase, partial [Actinomycetota bacterium]|nr:acetyl-CoA synthetase [Actinomycetota bacterium]
MPDFVWEPTPDYIQNANVTRLMRRVGIDDYHDLVEWSIDDVGRYWNEVVADLGIDFFEPYDRVLDDSRGPQWPRWFVGGRIN